MAKPIGGRPGLRGRLTTVLGLLGAGALGFWLGHGGSQPATFAQTPAAPPPPPAAVPSEYSQRVVAYIYGNTPLTRQDLGEYLIERFGTDKIDLFVNKKIIEQACVKRFVEVTAAEVEARIAQDMKELGGATMKDFVDQVLKPRGMTLFEYKEDVVKPGLLMEKLCKKRVEVKDEDLQKAFQAAYGPKVQCRIIIWPKGEERTALREYDEIRKSDEGFERKARSQSISDLAARGGMTEPIAHFAGVHADVERVAFSLKPGEVSQLIGVPEGTIVLKCDKHIPADATKSFEAEKKVFEQRVFERKLNEEMKTYFVKVLREEAKPVFILKKPPTAMELEKQVEQELRPTGGAAPAKK
jgi:parvulin-like peptidyl-prolyl isomerase